MCGNWKILLKEVSHWSPPALSCRTASRLSVHKRIQQSPMSAPAPVITEGFDLDHHLADVEKELLLRAMESAQGVKLKAAELLGISFRSFRYRLAKYGMAIDDD